MAPADLVFASIILLLAIKVTLSGFWSEFFSKAAVLAGGLAAVIGYRALAAVIVRHLGTDVLPEAIAFLVIFLAVYLLVIALQQLTGSLFEGESMTNLDRALGFFLGLAEGLLAVVVIIIALRSQPWFDTHYLLDGSMFARVLEPLLSEGRGIIHGIVPLTN